MFDSHPQVEVEDIIDRAVARLYGLSLFTSGIAALALGWWLA